jgi:hyaluronoglucosaminidase
MPTRGRTLVAIATAAIATTLAPCPDALAESPFPWRGVIQGNYGRPFNHDQRTRLIEFIAAHGFNAYVNAPKDDPYQRQAWRAQYPADKLAQFAAEIQIARGLGVEWIPAIGPDRPRHPRALPAGVRSSGQICFSCAPDRRALIAKLAPFWSAGARTFMVGFDDFAETLVHARDRARFGRGPRAYGEANAYLLNAIDAALRRRGDSARLITVPADYSGTDDSDYLRGLRSRLRAGIQVMWTGPQVRSRDFSPRQARADARLVGRRPVVWDNWINNDGSPPDSHGLPTRVFLGPYRRHSGIAGDVQGFFLNAATEPDLNPLPLATAGDWLRSPGSYHARRSFLRHVAELGGSAEQYLRAFAETSYATELIPRVEAPTASRRIRLFVSAYRNGGRWRHRLRAVDREWELARDAAAGMGANPDLIRFVREAGPFLVAARKSARAGEDATDLLAAERPKLSVRRRVAGFAGRVFPPRPAAARTLRATLAADERAVRGERHAAYGDRTGRYRLAPNVLWPYLNRVGRLDAGWNAAAAAASVELRLGSRPVQVASDGSYRLPVAACGRLLAAIDGAGGETSLLLPRCPN